MVPSMRNDLLFDDILFGNRAREEHDEFRAVLQHLGIEVVEIQELLRETLEQDRGREWILDALVENLSGLEVDHLRSASAEDLAERLVAGDRISAWTRDFGPQELFEIPPIPNWCFQRDPQFVLGRRVIFCSMATAARWRETVLSRAIFRFHPRFADVEPWIDPILPDSNRPLLLGLRRPAFEGGDLLVLSSEVLVVGYSERTNRTGIRQLAKALRRREGAPRWLLVVTLPRERAFMHLDTIFTMIDRDLCLAHGPVVLPGSDQTAEAYEIDLHSDDLHARQRGDLLPTLSKHGIELDHVLCGGSDPLDQQREQWTDGANALALAPGVIILYDRNAHTRDALAQKGFHIVQSADVIAGRSTIDLENPVRTCIMVPSSELSRARGGPHCLTQPLERDP